MTNPRFSTKQSALIERIRRGSCIHVHYTAGREFEAPNWFIRKPYSEEDGRTVNSLIARGVLHFIGDGDYALASQPSPKEAEHGRAE